MLITAVSGTAECGVFLTYWSFVSAGGMLLGWIGGIATRFLADSIQENSILSTSMIHSSLRLLFWIYSVLLIPLAAVIHFTYALSYLAQNSASPTHYTIATLIALIFLVSHCPDAYLMAARTRLDALHLIRAITTAMAVLLAAFGVYFFRDSSAAMYGYAVGFVALYLLCRQFIDRQPDAPRFTFPDKANALALWNKFRPAVGWAALYSILQTCLYLDPLYISTFIGTEQVTIFSYYWVPANFVILLLWRLSDNLEPFFMTALAEQSHTRVTHIYKRAVVKISTIVVACAACYWMLLPTFLYYWVGATSIADLPRVVFALFITLMALLQLDTIVFVSAVRYRLLCLLLGIQLSAKLWGYYYLHTQFGAVSGILMQAVALAILIHPISKYSIKRSILFPTGDAPTS